MSSTSRTVRSKKSDCGSTALMIGRPFAASQPVLNMPRLQRTASIKVVDALLRILLLRKTQSMRPLTAGMAVFDFGFVGIGAARGAGLMSDDIAVSAIA